MILYHASPGRLPVGNSLRTPTGAACMDVTAGGVVYLTDSPEQCERYGEVYEIAVTDAVPYADQRRRQGLPKKKGRYTRGVWVALPEKTMIRRRIESYHNPAPGGTGQEGTRTMKRITSDGKQVKITAAGRLYVDGVLTPTLSDGKPVADRITPLNLPDRKMVGDEIYGLAHDWAFRNYRMA